MVTVADITVSACLDFRCPGVRADGEDGDGGITFGNMYFVRPDAPESVHFHELVHVCNGTRWDDLIFC